MKKNTVLDLKIVTVYINIIPLNDTRILIMPVFEAHEKY